ncbi:MAG: hypothetical protein JO013_08595 [Alphaproteobacteria bacterium]|nr:hypothetical protein [Alphaproteobacteria bacterium]
MTARAISILLAAVAVAAPSASPEWAPVAITDNDGTVVYFVDRASIQADANGTSAWIYAVSPAVAFKMHVDYDCAGVRYRTLEVSLGPGAMAKGRSGPATPWSPVKAETPLASAMKYACSGGKVDFGFGDLVVKSPSPEAFARAFIARRAARK